jgi:hypothetical protein
MTTPNPTFARFAPLLLADPSPCLRWLALRDLFQRLPGDDELKELDGLRPEDPLVAGLLAFQLPDGSWREEAFGAGSHLSGEQRILPTSLALMRLGYLGFGPDFDSVRRGAEYLFDRQLPGSAWPLVRGRGEEEGEAPAGHEGYSMIPLQTALPLRALATCGYAEDRRAEEAYAWLLAQRLQDGAWPTGIASGTYGYVGGYRRLAHSRWGCRSNTTGALACLALHPGLRHSPEARQALDLLLGRETRERHTLGFETARLVGAESARGFITFYARFDLAQVLDLCVRTGVSAEDARVARLVEFIRQQQGPYGLWEYLPKPQASRWVTLDLLRSLSRLGEEGEGWRGLEPQTPFRPYPKKPRRY